MLSQSDHSSHRQKRELELRNVGPVAIPPYGVVEVVNANRLDATCPQEVYDVRRPTKDDLCSVLVNGPCEIPVGERGKIGWNDYPALALFGETPDYSGQPFGVKQNSFELYKHYCGFLYVGDYDGEKAQVLRWDHCESLVPVRAMTCIYPGSMNVTVEKMKWDCHTYANTGEYLCLDDPLCKVMALIDEVFWVHCPRCQDPSSECCCTPIADHGKRRRVRVESMIDCEQSGTATVLDCDGTTTQCQITVINKTNRKVACDGAEDLWATSESGCCTWKLEDGRRPERGTAELAASVCPGATGEVGINNVAFLDACGGGAVPNVARNFIGLAGCAGDKVKIEWDNDNCDWIITAIAQHELAKVMTDVKYEQPCAIKRRVVKKVGVNFCGDDCAKEEWETAITLLYETYIAELSGTCSGSDCSITYKTKTCCVFDGSCTDSDPIELLSATWVTVVTDVYQVGTSIWADFQDICVMCAGDETSLERITGTDCETSGSGA